MRRLNTNLVLILRPLSSVRPLRPVSSDDTWQVQAAPDGQLFALLEKPGPEIWATILADAVAAVPLSFGLLLGGPPIQMPEADANGGGRYFLA